MMLASISQFNYNKRGVTPMHQIQPNSQTAQKQKNHSETEWLMVVGVDGFRTALAVEPIPYKKKRRPKVEQ